MGCGWNMPSSLLVLVLPRERAEKRQPRIPFALGAARSSSVNVAFKNCCPSSILVRHEGTAQPALSSEQSKRTGGGPMSRAGVQFGVQFGVGRLDGPGNTSAASRSSSLLPSAGAPASQQRATPTIRAI